MCASLAWWDNGIRQWWRGRAESGGHGTISVHETPHRGSTRPQVLRLCLTLMWTKHNRIFFSDTFRGMESVMVLCIYVSMIIDISKELISGSYNFVLSSLYAWTPIHFLTQQFWLIYTLQGSPVSLFCMNFLTLAFQSLKAKAKEIHRSWVNSGIWGKVVMLELDFTIKCCFKNLLTAYVHVYWCTHSFVSAYVCYSGRRCRKSCRSWL